MAQIPINQLPVEELNQYKEGIEQEIQQLAQSLQVLKTARDRFHDSKTCIEHLKTYKEGEKVLVPLTSSLYVQGEFGDTSKCIIDVGTGYYIKQNLDKGADFMERKMKFITENMEKVQQVLGNKQQQLEAVVGTMQKKLYEAQQQAKA